MTYLKGLLKEDAESSISGFKITDENYETSVNLLKERCNSKQQLFTHDKSLKFTSINLV